jgi:hypothetical protein
MTVVLATKVCYSNTNNIKDDDEESKRSAESHSERETVKAPRD